MMRLLTTLPHVTEFCTGHGPPIEAGHLGFLVQ